MTMKNTSESILWMTMVFVMCVHWIVSLRWRSSKRLLYSTKYALSHIWLAINECNKGKIRANLHFADRSYLPNALVFCWSCFNSDRITLTVLSVTLSWKVSVFSNKGSISSSQMTSKSCRALRALTCLPSRCSWCALNPCLYQITKWRWSICMIELTLSVLLDLAPVDSILNIIARSKGYKHS